MSTKRRKEAKRQITRSIANLETGRIHLDTFLNMGYSELESTAQATVYAITMIDETQKLLTRLKESF